RGRRSGGGCRKMPSARGSNVRGSSLGTRTSRPRRGGASTSSPPPGRGRASANGTSASPPPRKPPTQPPPACPPPRPPPPPCPHPRRTRVPPRRRPGLSRGLGRPPRQGLRLLRAHHRHRTLRPPGGAGHGHRALRLGSPRVLGRRQRQQPPRPTRC